MGKKSFFLHVSCVMFVCGNDVAKSIRMLLNIYQMPSVLLDMKKIHFDPVLHFYALVYSNKIED